MNFIDKAMAEVTNGEDFVQKMADIYEYPEVREELENYPTWIRNIIAVIDYDTELAMDGLEFKSCLIKGMDYLYVLLPVSLGKTEAAL